MAIDFRVWAWEPNGGMTETLEWKTDITTGVSGAEQRVCTRRHPRQSFDATCRFKTAFDQSNALLAISAGQSLVWGWPCWHEMQRITSNVSAGDTTIAVDTSTADYRDSDYALLWVSATAFEVLEVSTVGTSSISLSTEVASDFAAGRTLIMPLRRANISPSTAVQDRAVGGSDVSVKAVCLDSVDLAADPSALQFRGQDVLSDRLLMPADTRQRVINRNLWTLDSDTGIFNIRACGDFPSVTTDLRWRNSNRQESWRLREWLHRRVGRLVPVWVPYWTEDLVITGRNVLSTDTAITIRDINLKDYWEDHPGKQNLALITSRGDIVTREIVSVTDGSIGEEVIQLNSTVSIDGVVRVSFLALCRLAGDSIEFNWETVGVSEVKTSVVEVPA